MEASEFVPALRFARHPAARLLLMVGAEARPSWFVRIREVAAELGHVLESAADWPAFTGSTPEAIFFDGGAASTPAQMRELRALTALENVPFVALIAATLSDETLAELQEAGAGGFVDVEAAALDMASRLQVTLELARARAEIAGLREQLNRQLRVDDVTGVMTRRFFFQQAHRECARARRYGHPLSCLMVEVNHYRMLCASFSDATAESVLRAVATTLGQWTRDSDIIARFAEAKFVILLPETDLDGATAAREKILKALREHLWRYDNQILPVSVSIGESKLELSKLTHSNNEFTSEGDEMGEGALSTREAMAGLLEDSDAALYVARKGARVPGMFVPYTPAPDEVPLLRSL